MYIVKCLKKREERKWEHCGFPSQMRDSRKLAALRASQEYNCSLPKSGLSPVNSLETKAKSCQSYLRYCFFTRELNPQKSCDQWSSSHPWSTFSTGLDLNWWLACPLSMRSTYANQVCSLVILCSQIPQPPIV